MELIYVMRDNYRNIKDQVTSKNKTVFDLNTFFQPQLILDLVFINLKENEEVQFQF